MGVAMAAVGFAPSPAAAAPPYGLLKLVFNCSRVGPVTVTVRGTGVLDPHHPGLLEQVVS